MDGQVMMIGVGKVVVEEEEEEDIQKQS